MNYSKIFVCSPTTVTGGPELLHQLVHELRAIGHEAFVVYYPFDREYECPESYRHFNAPQTRLTDDPDALVVIPETATWIARRQKKSHVAIWWLSVDNYFGWRGESKARDLLVHLKGLLRPRNFTQRKSSFFRMKKYTHLFQSEYARNFLAYKWIEGTMLTDYLNDVYLNNAGDVDVESKRNVVCYNPKKGPSKTDRLRKSYPEMEFIPIQCLPSSGVYDLLCRSKIYIDFGNHPGKDRLPREAAMARCCVITGRRGSAGNEIDVPLPPKFKLDDASDNYVDEFEALALDVFANFNMADHDMVDYRKKIREEKEIFKKQVRGFFGLVGAGDSRL